MTTQAISGKADQGLFILDGLALGLAQDLTPLSGGNEQDMAKLGEIVSQVLRISEKLHTSSSLEVMGVLGEALGRQLDRAVDVGDKKLMQTLVGIAADIRDEDFVFRFSKDLRRVYSVASLFSLDAEQTTFTTGEVAKICKVSLQTIIRCFDRGRIGGFRVPDSKFRRIPRAELLKFMQDNKIPTTNLEMAEAIKTAVENTGVDLFKQAVSGAPICVTTEYMIAELARQTRVRQ
jgi:excisionase family DNA binding protein